jgi:hypothetical protein
VDGYFRACTNLLDSLSVLAAKPQAFQRDSGFTAHASIYIRECGLMLRTWIVQFDVRLVLQVARSGKEPRSSAK